MDSFFHLGMAEMIFIVHSIKESAPFECLFAFLSGRGPTEEGQEIRLLLLCMQNRWQRGKGGGGEKGKERSCERGAAPLLPTGVIPVDQLCNSTKLEHYRWSGSISDAYRDRREKTNTVLKGEEENRKTLSDKRHGVRNHTEQCWGKLYFQRSGRAWACMCTTAAHVPELKPRSKQRKTL